MTCTRSLITVNSDASQRLVKIQTQYWGHHVVWSSMDWPIIRKLCDYDRIQLVENKGLASQELTFKLSS